MHKLQLKEIVRLVLVIAVLSILGWRLYRIYEISYEITSTTSVTSIPYNDAVQKSIEVLLDQSNSWAQLTIILLGLLGALWVAKHDEVRLELTKEFWPEIALWIAVVLLLVLGLYCHNEYLSGISTALESGGTTSKGSLSIPNVFVSRYESLLQEQFLLLVIGGVTSALALFSVGNLAGGHRVQS